MTLMAKVQKRMQQYAKYMPAPEPEETQAPPTVAPTPQVILDWCVRYLPHLFQGKPGEFHAEILEMLLTSSRVAVAAPRGHAKSVVVTLGYVLYRMAHRQARFVVVVGASQQLAEEHVGNVYNECVENEQLLTDYPHLRVPNAKERVDKKSKTRQGDFLTVGKIRVTAKGAGSRMRGMREGGQRPDLVVLDDLEEDKQVETAAQRRKLKDWFLKSVSNLFGAEGGQLAIVGTILHKESLLNWLVGPDAPPAYARKKYSALRPDGTPLWPEWWSQEKLDAKLAEVGTKAFSTEYLNDPAQDDAVLFKPEWITYRKPEGLTSIVIALDPSTSADGQRDACGISVAGRRDASNFSVLADETLNGSPSTWARRALDLFDLWQANEIVAEANQGGAMVISTLKAELRPGERLPPIRLVHATKGKAIRAEPIAVAYERGEVTHAERFRDLEIEMTHWVPGMPSPNRLDALVWALTWLMNKPDGTRQQRPTGSVVMNNTRR